METYWKCAVCGYQHKKEDRPGQCPLCGAEESEFLRPEKEMFHLPGDMMRSLILHPAAAHFPNGLLPTALLFVLLAMGLSSPSLEKASYYMVCVAIVVWPVSFFSGLYDWKTKMRGYKAKIFYKKIALATLLLFFLLSALILGVSVDDILIRGGWLAVAYLLLYFGMFGCVVLLGHYGGKLAYQWKKKAKKT